MFGVGTTADPEAALRMFRMAAAEGEVQAVEVLMDLASDGLYVGRDDVLALQLARFGTALGSGRCAGHLVAAGEPLNPAAGQGPKAGIVQFPECLRLEPARVRQKFREAADRRDSALAAAEATRRKAVQAPASAPALPEVSRRSDGEQDLNMGIRWDTRGNVIGANSRPGQPPRFVSFDEQYARIRGQRVGPSPEDLRREQQRLVEAVNQSTWSEMNRMRHQQTWIPH